MTKNCRKTKHKEKKRLKQEKTKQCPQQHKPVSSVNSEEIQPLFNLGEGDYEEIEEKKPEKSAFDRFKDWVQQQRFIPHDLSDDFLILFLTAAGYKVELAAEKMERYFYSRQEPSYLYRNRDPMSQENIEIFKKLYVIPMPGTTKDGRKVIITGLVRQTLSYNQLDHAKALAMVLDLLIWENNFSFGEFAIILDGRGFECPQLLENKIHNQRTIKSLILDTIPGMLRSFYLLYPPPHVAKIADNRNGLWMTVVKTKQKLTEFIPGSMLPEEYGGSLGSLEELLAKWELHMYQNRKFFLNFEKRMINDYRRKLCYKTEMENRGKNWVQNMKLEADEWEYKIQYYERMKNMTPLQHPAFGSKRNLNKPTNKSREDRLRRIKQKAREEAEKAKLFQPSPFYNGYAKEIRKAQLEALLEKWKQCCESSPILELEIFCCDDVMTW